MTKMNENRTYRRHARIVVRVADSGDFLKRALPALVAAAALALAFAATRDAHAGTYKWVDEKGIVHYADKMPADAVNRANVQLDSQGIAVRKTDAAPTPEQLRARVGDVERQKHAAKEREDVERRDRALLSSYTREQDIELARARALTTIEGQVQSARVYIAQLTKRQQELLERKQSFGTQGAPPAVERELESIESELQKTNALAANKKQEGVAVGAKYDGDKQRWRELQTIAEANAAKEKVDSVSAAQVGGSSPNVVSTSGGK